MAVLRADGAFVRVSTVGAPRKGVACPGATHANRAFITPYLYYITF